MMRGGVKEKVLSYDDFRAFAEGWLVFAKGAHTFKVRGIVIRDVENGFPGQILSGEPEQASEGD